MCLSLWPDDTVAEMEATLAVILNSPKFKILLAYKQNAPIGFVYSGVRSDYVERADNLPQVLCGTGFSENWRCPHITTGRRTMAKRVGVYAGSAGYFFR